MASPQPGPNDTRVLNFDPSDLVNIGPFMDALVNFLNEAWLCISEVKQRVGLSPGCTTTVNMNEEEKEEKLKDILITLVHKCKLELTKNASPAGEDGNYNGPSDFTVRESELLKRTRPEVSRPGTSPMKRQEYYDPATRSNIYPSSSAYSQLNRVVQRPYRRIFSPKITSENKEKKVTHRGPSNYSASSAERNERCPPHCGQ